MPPGCRSIAKEKSSLRVVDLHGTSPTNGETFIDSQEVTDMLMATKSNPVARINTSIWCRGPVECDAEWSGHHACSGNRSLRGPCASLLHARGFGEGAQRIEKVRVAPPENYRHHPHAGVVQFAGWFQTGNQPLQFQVRLIRQATKKKATRSPAVVSPVYGRVHTRATLPHFAAQPCSLFQWP